MNFSGKQLALIGFGGHGVSLRDALSTAGYTPELIIDSAFERETTESNVRFTNEDTLPGDFSPEAWLLVNGIGSVGNMQRRKDVFIRWKERGYSFATVVHPSAVLSATATLEEGVQILAGAIVGPEAYIGQNTIVNSGAIVEHHCQLGPHTHIAPGAILCGSVTIGESSHIGAGAIIIQNCIVEDGSLIRAGELVKEAN